MQTRPRGVVELTLELAPETERRLRRIPAVLHAEFPHADETKLAAEVDTAARELLETARIEAFVPVLAHRTARERLLVQGEVRADATGLAARFLARPA